jgi:hypothetical protein
MGDWLNNAGQTWGNIGQTINGWTGGSSGLSGGATPSASAATTLPANPYTGGVTGGASSSGWTAPGGMPSMMTNGQLDPAYYVPGASAPGSSYNAQPLNNLQNYASQAGPSPWLTSANAEVAATQAQGLGQNAAAANASDAGASEMAATHGGLTGGGAARIDAVGAQGQAAADSATNMGAAQATNQNTVQDWQNKLAVSEGLPAQEAQAATTISQPQEFNAAQTQGAESTNAATATQGFGQIMNGYLGNTLASATANSKKTGI